MRKIFILATIFAAGIGPGYAIDMTQFQCCVGTVNGTCDEMKCPGSDGVTRYYTNCNTCTGGRTKVMNGPYNPCGNKTLDSSYGECKTALIDIGTSCVAGQYGLNGKCIDCPDNGTSAPESQFINSCYIPAGQGGSDGTGTWQYDQNCYYTLTIS